MSEPVNVLASWETRDGTVRELHLCPPHFDDLAGSLRLAGAGCIGSPTEQGCEICANGGDWPVLTQPSVGG